MKKSALCAKEKIDINFNGLPKAYYTANKNVDTLMASASGEYLHQLLTLIAKKTLLSLVFNLMIDLKLFILIPNLSKKLKVQKI